MHVSFSAQIIIVIIHFGLTQKERISAHENEKETVSTLISMNCSVCPEIKCIGLVYSRGLYFFFFLNS